MGVSVSVLENCFLINLIFLSCTFLYMKDSPTYNNDVMKVLITSVAISLTFLMGIIIYHIYVQLKDNNFLKRVSQLIKSNLSVVVSLSADASNIV